MSSTVAAYCVRFRSQRVLTEVGDIGEMSNSVVVLPGEAIDSKIGGDGVVKVGQGLRVDKESAVVAVPGILQCRKPAAFWVDTIRKKYYPRVGDQVVGIVEEKGGDFYMVNIFCGMNCILNRLAFDGATKRNRPELKRGEVIYARVLSTGGLEGDVEISCASSSAVKRDWSSGETVSPASSIPFFMSPIETFCSRFMVPYNLDSF